MFRFPLLFFIAVSVSAVFGEDKIEERAWPQIQADLTAEFAAAQAPEEKRAVIRQFGEHDRVESAQFLMRFLTDKKAKPSWREETIQVLSKMQDPEARALIKEAATSAREISRPLLEAYIAQGDPESRVFLLNLVRKAPGPRLQALAIDGVSLLDQSTVSTKYVEALVDLMKDEEAFHGVRISATNALGKIPSPTAIPDLILLLENPLLGIPARDALLRLTGVEHWMDQKSWISWWKENREGYEVRMLSPRRFNYKRQELSSRFGDGSGIEAAFYGLSVKGQKILFILDSSGSMYAADRMVTLKTEMSGIIQSLTENYEYGILTFPKTRFPGKDFDTATLKFRERGLEFIEEMQPGGDTPMGEALEHAFKRIIPRNGVDTVYLLTDGVPSDLNGENLSDIVLELNEETAVEIHTVFINNTEERPAIGAAPVAVVNQMSDYMKKIENEMKQVATDSGGKFWKIE